MTSIEPGWYRDPAEPTTQRYWDGEGWLGDPIPADATPPASPPQVAPPPAAPPAPVSPPQPAVPLPQQSGGPLTPPSQAGGPLMPPSQAGGPLMPPSQAGGPMAPQSWGAPPAVPLAMLRRLVAAPRPHGFALAPVSARFVARMIDILAVLALNVAVNGWFVAQWLREIWPYVEQAWRAASTGQSTGDISLSSRAAWLEFTILGISMALWFAYEVPATANSGQTLGKRLMHIKVLRVESDQPLGIGRAWRRWNPLGLPILLWSCYGFGFLLQGADLLIGLVDRPLHQALHDKSAGTVVVQVPPARRDGADQNSAARDGGAS